MASDRLVVLVGAAVFASLAGVGIARDIALREPLPRAALADPSAGPSHETMREVVPGPNAPTVDLTVVEDPHGGWTVNVATQNFAFAPQNASGPHRQGEGHAHLYANGRKIARLYGPWHFVDALPAGEVRLMVMLSTNDHAIYAVGGAPVMASHTITVE